MTQPGAPDPGSQPPYGQPHQQPTGNYPDAGSAGYGQQAQPGYGQQPQPGYNQPAQPGYGQQGSPSIPGVRPGTPGTVIGAAVLGFVTALFTLLGAFGLFALSGFSVIFALLGILYLAVSAGFIAGGVMALTGKTGQILFITAVAAAGLVLLGLIITLAQGYAFSVTSLIGLIIAGAIIFMLLQPASKAFFAGRR